MPTADLSVSIIIPCLNDAAALRRVLPGLSAIEGVREVIVADASCVTEPAMVAETFGARVVRCGKPNRGGQMNTGAAAAGGDILLFHHADVELGAEHIASLRNALGNDGRIIGGAYHRKFDPSQRLRRPLVPIVRWWNRTGGTLWGDQSVFVRRAHFIKLGGFAAIPLMEDVEFSRRLRRSGRVVLLDPPVLASARRHQQRGATRVSLENFAFITMFKLGVSPYTLHRWYYGRPKPPPSGLQSETGG